LRQSNFQLKEANEELMRSEEAVRELADELETRVEQRTTELIQKNEQLQRINADLDNFVYTASHDLRSPIANLEGLLQTLIRRNKDKLAGGDTGVLDMMNDSIIRLNRTIADLTGIARMQKDLDEASNEKVTFAEILSEVQSDIRPLITEADAVIETHLEVPDIHYSRKNLRSILHNLISNALKYHSPDRRAEVKIETQTAGPYVVLCVIDNGLGIPANQQQRIFSLFRRAHTHVEGSGIGLYIVKRIVENSGGRIELESQPGKGSTFKIYLKSLTDTYQSSSAAQLDLTEMDEVE
jgi:signal transduction histidine kinase